MQSVIYLSASIPPCRCYTDYVAVYLCFHAIYEEQRWTNRKAQAPNYGQFHVFHSSPATKFSLKGVNHSLQSLITYDNKRWDGSCVGCLDKKPMKFAGAITSWPTPMKADSVENCEKSENKISERQIRHEPRKMIMRSSLLDCCVESDRDDP